MAQEIVSMSRFRSDATFQACVFGTLLAFLCFGVCSASERDDQERLAFFESKVRPLLIEKCLECHDRAGEMSGGLALSDRDGVLAGGDSGPAVDLQKPAASLLIKAIRYDDPHLQMPPENPLSADEKAILLQWIADGLRDPRAIPNDLPIKTKQIGLPVERAQEHWAYRPIVDVEVPTIVHNATEQNGEVSSSPIDALLAQKMEEQNVAPVGRTDPETIRRRLNIDLHGLSPSKETYDIAAWKNEADYLDYVDWLLASERFGERFARHWMDIARYADSITLRGQLIHDAWRYRNYLIDSFNADKPFDQFVREQIAGDALAQLHGDAPIADRQAWIIATSYLVLGNNNLEEQDKPQLEMDMVDEQLDVIGKGLLGQTISCARCHDHKFDPIPTADYYALAGILKTVMPVKHANVSELVRTPLALPPDEAQAFDAIEDQLEQLKLQQQSLTKMLNDMTKSERILPETLPGVVIDDTQAAKVGNWQSSTYIKPYVLDGYVHDQNQNKGGASITFTAENLTPGLYDVRLAYQFADNRSEAVKIVVAHADGEAYLTINQKKQAPIQKVWSELGRYRFEEKGQAYVLITNAESNGHVVADAVQFILVQATNQLSTDLNLRGLSGEYNAKSVEEELNAIKQKMTKLEARLKERPRAAGFNQNEAKDLPIHVRGSVHSLGKTVPRGMLSCLTCSHSIGKDTTGRLALADWLVDPRNPLTARVYVNRIWKHLMGRGLVESLDNFGTSGNAPTHPLLLDYLASEFIKNKWSTKWLVKTIVASEAYRRSAHAETLAIDQLPIMRSAYAIAQRRTIDGEALRDSILQSSGELDLSRDQGELIRELTNDYNYQFSSHQRSVYLPVFRNSKHPFLSLMDGADPSTVVGNRNETIVSSQALFFLNSPWIDEQADKIASRFASDESIELSVRVDNLWRLLLSRKPRADERELAFELLQNSTAETQHELWKQLIVALIGSIDFRQLD